MPEFRNVDDVIKRYDAAIRWLERLGIEPPPDGRWLHARESLRLIATLNRMSKAEFMASLDTLHAAMFDRQEAHDLIRVHVAYEGKQPDHVLQRRLTKTRGGAPHPRDEGPDGGPRNWFAELSWGAMLEGSGFATDLRGEPDVLWLSKVLVGPRPPMAFSCEVKRPASLRQVSKRIGEGADQIGEAMRGEINTAGWKVEGGVVVLVIDRLMPPKPDVLDPLPEAELKKYAGAAIDRFIGDNYDAITSARGAWGVVGVHLWWRPLLLLQREDGTGRRTWADFHQQRFVPYVEDQQDWRYGLVEPWVNRVKSWWPAV